MRNRALFLGILLLIAVVGIVTVVALTRPREQPRDAKTVEYVYNGEHRTAVGIPFSGDPSKGARFALGDPKAPVTVVEFASYTCNACASWNTLVKAEFLSEFVDSGRVRYIYRDFPAGGELANFERAAVAASCANDQGQFWQYHDVLFRAQQTWRSERAIDGQLVNLAEQIGLDGNAMRTCLTSDTQRLEAVRVDGQAGSQLGVSATPTFFVNGYRYEAARPIEFFRALLGEQKP